jgi:hypothetical protein
LDLALPVYSWAIVVRNSKVYDLIQNTNKRNFTDTAFFTSCGNDIFVSRASFFLHGRYFMKNDTLKIERVSPALCEEAARDAASHLAPLTRTVSLFEYDTVYTSSYEKSDFEKIYSAAH